MITTQKTNGFIGKLLVQVLSDDEKRSLYDKYGEAGLKGAGMGMGVSRSPIMIKENAFRIFIWFGFFASTL